MCRVQGDVFAQISQKKTKNTPKVDTATAIRDTLSPAVRDSLYKVRKDSLTRAQMKKDIETTIKYQAEDSIVLDAENKTVYLYDKSKVDYGSRHITSSTLDFDMNTSIVTARYGKDSVGNKIDVPVFEEGKDTYEAEYIRYNYRTKRGQVKEIVTKQGEGVIHGEVVKKEPTNEMYVEHAEYTTCDLREPHFTIKATRIKVIPKKKIITGPFNLQIDDIPTLLAFPFAVFPTPKKRGSGIIMPSYGESRNNGFFLSNLGGFLALNDYMGYHLVSDLYTSGGYRINNYLDYKSRYAFTGRLNFAYTNLINNPDEPYTRSLQNNIWVRWNHTALNKGTGKFNASVNAGSPNFNRNTEFNVNTRQTANFSSNVSYSNLIKRTPFAYSVALRQEQNIATKIMNFDLPSANFNMQRQYPFKNIQGFVRKIEPIKNINYAYSSTFSNKIGNLLSNTRPSEWIVTPFIGTSTVLGAVSREALRNQADSAATVEAYLADSTASANYYRPDTLSASRLFSNFGKYSKWTATHSIPISTSIKVMRYFNVNPNFTYSEQWYDRSYDYSEVDQNGLRKVKVDTTRGLDLNKNATRKWNAGASITTRIYGTFYIKKWNMEALRHTLVPTLGYTYAPDFSYQEWGPRIRIRNDTSFAANPYRYFNRFSGQGSNTLNNQKERQDINFSLGNTFELKVRDVKDTTKIAYKKIKILDNLNIGSSYNIMADSFNLRDINISARTRLFEIIDINFGAVMDPYYYENYNQVLTSIGHNVYRRRRYLAWNQLPEEGETESSSLNLTPESQGIGRITSMNFNIGSQFRSKAGKGKKIPMYGDGTDRYFIGGPQVPYVDFNLPWTLRVNYRLDYNRYTSGGTYGSTENRILIERSSFRNNISLGGDVSLSAKWKWGFTTGYNLTTGTNNRNQDGISNTVFNISRDLHCWIFTFQWAAYPLTFQYFLATLAVKASTLADLKIPRRSVPFRDN